MKCIAGSILFILVVNLPAYSQNNAAGKETLPDPKVAFLKSLVLPGWGHRYIDRRNWNRGKYHLAADGIMILSIVGLNIHSSNLQENWISFAKLQAGVDIKGRERFFQLAVGDFNNLEDYNNFQERIRNWDQLLDDIQANRWNWESVAERERYNDLRSRFESIDRQIPAIIGLMIVNRVVSGISAYTRAQKRISKSENIGFHMTTSGHGGLLAHFNIRF